MFHQLDVEIDEFYYKSCSLDSCNATLEIAYIVYVVSYLAEGLHGMNLHVYSWTRYVIKADEVTDILYVNRIMFTHQRK